MCFHFKRPIPYEEFLAGTKKLTEDLLTLLQTNFAEEPTKPKQRKTKHDIVVVDEDGK